MVREQTIKGDNPWLGLVSYEEGDSKHLFCGRDQATKEVVTLVDNNLFLLLYGQTGVGKTSLLNAGVFPALRKCNYLPLYIRLGMFDEDRCFSEVIVKSILAELKKYSCDVKLQQNLDVADKDYLWKFFSSSIFYNEKKEIIYPVIVLDQFEEIFLKRKDDAWALMTEIYKLLDDTQIIDTSMFHTDTNFRFVVSIREDYLYRLEECIDTLHLTEMLYCRYRLLPMSVEEARSVILIPGENVIAPTDADVIAEKVIDIAQNENEGNVSSLLLSLACSQLFQIANSLNAQTITKNHLRLLDSNPLDGLYKKARQKLKRRQLKFIENNLIDNEGKRTSVSWDAYEKLGCDKAFIEGDNRIFNVITIKNKHGINKRIELLHDLLAKSVYEGKMKKNDVANFFKKLAYNGIFYAIVLFLDLFIVMYFLLSRQINNNLLMLLLVSGVFLLIGTCVVNIGQMYKDIKMEVGILPQISSSLYFFVCLKHPGMNLHAYHSLKPSVVATIGDVFMIVNILLFILAIIQITINREELGNRYTWKELLGIKKSLFDKTLVMYFSVVLGTVLSFVLIYNVPKTKIELLRERAEQMDPNALYEMGEYYTQYYPNLEKAKEYFEKAMNLGHERAKNKLASVEHDSYRRFQTTPMDMKVNAMKAYTSVANADSVGWATICYIANDYKYTGGAKIVPEDSLHVTYKVFYNYNEKTNDSNAYMYWKCRAAFYHHNSIGNVGYEFWRGEFVEQDLVRAFELYVEGESHDNIIACYLYGWGVEQSLSKAKEYYVNHIGECKSSWQRYLLW